MFPLKRTWRFWFSPEICRFFFAAK